MTVRLLIDWYDSRDGRQYVAGNLLTTDSGTETGLVTSKMADANLTGGTAYVAQVVPTQYRDAKIAIDTKNSKSSYVVGIDGLPIKNAGGFALKKWRLALGNALSGLSNARIVFVGDSTTAGLSNAGTLKFMQSAPCVAGKILNRSLMPVNLGSTFGDLTKNNPANGFPAFDSRIGGFASWAQTAYLTAGGYAFGNSANTNSLTFTPTDAFDTIDIYSIDNTGYGTWTVNVDGGAALATVNNGQTPRVIRKTTVSCALGTHVINIQRTGVGGVVYIIGIATRNSTQQSIDIYNIGAGGSTSTDWATDSGISHLSALKAYTGDLYVIDVGINDRRQAWYSSSYETNLRTIVAAAKITGDVILCLPAPSAKSYSTYTTLDNIAAYNAAIYRVAADYGCQVADKEILMQSYDEANGNGYYNDTLHPNAAGYALIGQYMASIIPWL